ncbi:hypothetical protein CBR_g44534 [Chara braunii]|uniref:Late embryogenesis abundant protein LEA-2 subgroup domain-containing protein n=1 Tax=Chara braunii TaxID=69332 RepID=A0A388LXN2_CHABU|nr:hypothetical protein CBR_g44534 [Chara braunii]|eukprot:GBG87077.1 hypothetical protein CBR_g44534 [Chara braunii]
MRKAKGGTGGGEELQIPANEKRGTAGRAKEGHVWMAADPKAVHIIHPTVKMMADPRATACHMDAAAQVRADHPMAFHPYHALGSNTGITVPIYQGMCHNTAGNGYRHQAPPPMSVPVSWPATPVVAHHCQSSHGVDVSSSSPAIGYLPGSHAPSMPVIHLSINTLQQPLMYDPATCWHTGNAAQSYPPLLTLHEEDKHVFRRASCQWSRRLTVPVFAVAIIALIIAAGVILRPRSPDFDLVDVTVSALKLRSAKRPSEGGGVVSELVLDVNLTVMVSVANPNHVGVFYRNSIANVLYREHELGKAVIPAGWDAAGGFNIFEFIVAIDGAATRGLGPALLTDFLRRKMLLTINSEITGWVELLFLHVPFKVWVECDLLVNPLSVSLIDRSCMWRYNPS